MQIICLDGHKDVIGLEKHQVYLKSVFNKDYNFDRFKQDYLSGYSINDISVKYELPADFLYALFKDLNFNLRTSSENKKTNQYAAKYKSTVLDKYGVENISQSDIIKQKKIETSLLNNGYVNNFCNNEIRNKTPIDYKKVQDTTQKVLFEKYGVTNVAQIDYVRQKISNSHKQLQTNYSYEDRIRNTTAARQNVNYTSKIQKRVQSLIDTLFLSYKDNCFIGGYNFDFVFSNKYILEIQGEYWHANPIKYKSADIIRKGLTAQDIWLKDSLKKKYVEDKGYKIYYLWENQIHRMTDDEIISFIKNIIDENI